MNADIDAIARTAYGEARGLGEDGMRAVICVIVNRVSKKAWYGLTAYEVCHKYETMESGRTIYQFDCWDPKDPNCAKCQNVTTNDPQFVIAMQLAEDSQEFNWMDVTDGALNYFSTTIPLPSWARGHNPCYSIGNMLFYNNIS